MNFDVIKVELAEQKWIAIYQILTGKCLEFLKLIVSARITGGWSSCSNMKACAFGRMIRTSLLQI
jgi:hypothetical protein